MKISDILPEGNEFKQVAAAQVEAEQKMNLMDYPNVVGLAIGTKEKAGSDSGNLCLTALVSAKLDRDLLSKDELVPNKVMEVPTDVVEIGEIFSGDIEPSPTSAQLLDTEDLLNREQRRAAAPEEMPVSQAGTATSLTRRRRPAMGGCSVGHYNITAGTLGTCCYDANAAMPTRYYMLSNNHVLANSNNAKIGDIILQPGPYDGGKQLSDDIARLARYIPIKFHSGSSKPINYVDAAIAEGNFHDLNREIYWIGYVKDMYRAAQKGLQVQKVGRTTGYTRGSITQINATVDVNYGGGKVARFGRQIITTRMSAGGDSGSLVMDMNEHAVGLLFAGSSRATILNNIWYVQALLGIRIHEH